MLPEGPAAVPVAPAPPVTYLNAVGRGHRLEAYRTCELEGSPETDSADGETEAQGHRDLVPAGSRD